MGPALQELKTDKTSTVNKLPLPDYNVGVIAGKYDHKVPPTSAKLSDNSNFIIVPSAHTFIMNSRTVKKQILYFLKQGSFRED